MEKFAFNAYIYLQRNNIPRLKVISVLTYVFILCFQILLSSFTFNRPKELSNIKSLNTINLSNNKLKGVITESTSDGYAALKYLNLSYNSFDGIILIAQNLISLDVSYNNLKKSLNYNFEFKTLPNLEIFNIDGNAFTSSIPGSLCFMTKLKTFSIAHSNYLTGTFPSCMSKNMTQMVSMSLSGTGISGQLPSTLYEMTNLISFQMRNTKISGDLPMLSPSTIQYIDFSYNYKLNTLGIPEEYKTLINLKSIQLQQCNFSGNMDRIFDFTKQTSLELIDISSNSFTGIINSDIFNIKNLYTLSLGVNCLHGGIPKTICNAKSLQNLLLDGLSSSSQCQKYIFRQPNIFDFDAKLPTITKKIEDLSSLPECTYSLPSLIQLHASGNFFQGELFDIPSNSQLISIDLGHNIFTGTVPKNILNFGLYRGHDVYPPGTVVESKQKLIYNSLILSYNRLKSGLKNFVLDTTHLPLVKGFDGGTYYEATVDLAFNRFSGSIPKDMKFVSYPSLLHGSMMKCTKEDLPLPQDPYAEDFICGSEPSNSAFLSFLVFACIVLVIYLLASERLFKIGGGKLVLYYEKIMRWALVVNDRRMEQDAKSPHTYAYLRFLRKLKYFTYINFWLFVIVMLVYTILKVSLGGDNAAYEHEYIWTPTAAFLVGTKPAVALLVMWVIVVGVVFYQLTVQLRSVTRVRELKDEQGDDAYKNKNKNNTNTETNTNTSTNTNTKNEATSQSQPRPKNAVAVQALITIDDSPPLTTLQTFNYILILIIIVVTNTSTVMFFNWSYTLIVYRDSSEAIKGLAKVYMAVFWVTWNQLLLPRLLLLVRYAGPLDSIARSSRKLWGSSLAFSSALLVFNNLIAPFLAVVVSDRNCLRNLFTSADSVTRPYSYYACVQPLDSGECIMYESQKNVITYTPTFVYNYQCSSDVLQAYVPVITLVALWNAFCGPFIIIVFRTLVTKWFGWSRATSVNDEEDPEAPSQFFGSSFEGDRASIGEDKTKINSKLPQWLRWVMLYFIPRKLWSEAEEVGFQQFSCFSGSLNTDHSKNEGDGDKGLATAVENGSGKKKGRKTRKVSGNANSTTLSLDNQRSMDKSSNSSTITETLTEGAMNSRSIRYIDGSSSLSNIIGTLVILGTFGIAVPLLAIALSAQLVITITIEEILLGRLLYEEVLRGNSGVANVVGEGEGDDQQRLKSRVAGVNPPIGLNINNTERLLMREHDPRNRLLTLEEDCMFSGIGEFLTGRWMVAISAVIFLSGLLFDIASDDVGWKKGIIYPFILCGSAIFFSIDLDIITRYNFLPEWLMPSQEEDKEKVNIDLDDDGGVVSLSNLGTAPKDVFSSRFVNANNNNSTDDRDSLGLGGRGTGVVGKQNMTGYDNDDSDVDGNPLHHNYISKLRVSFSVDTPTWKGGNDYHLDEE
jgi:hypothetical protein